MTPGLSSLCRAGADGQGWGTCACTPIPYPACTALLRERRAAPSPASADGPCFRHDVGHGPTRPQGGPQARALWNPQAPGQGEPRACALGTVAPSQAPWWAPMPTAAAAPVRTPRLCSNSADSPPAGPGTVVTSACGAAAPSPAPTLEPRSVSTCPHPELLVCWVVQLWVSPPTPILLPLHRREPQEGSAPSAISARARQAGETHL